MKNNPIQTSEFIRKKFSDYISSTYVIDDDVYQEELSSELKSIDLFKGPYLNVSLPFMQSDNISTLVKKGSISKEFLKISSIDPYRPLYKHQVDALGQIQKGHSVVITTGTGSGKTESFLYPILNSIMEEIVAGNKQNGIRAILLYPMNALVNDQMERLRGILKDYPEITYGSFTSATPEKITNYDVEKKEEQEGIHFPPNEILSRERIRKTPPDILFTNYSMLEFLLLRPSDFSIFNSEFSSTLQYIVLDEAHTYKGALGIEIAMLLRRVSGIVQSNAQFILTSATLGSKEDVSSIVHFAENLTSRTYDESDVIFATRKYLDRSNIEYKLESSVYSELLENIADYDRLANIAKKYIDIKTKDVNEILFELLKRDKNVYTLYDYVKDTKIFDDTYNYFKENLSFSKNELISLIHLVTLASENNQYLFDAKFHLFIKAPNGAFVTIGMHKKLKFSNHNTIDGYKAFEIGICKNCNAVYLIGKIKNDFLQPNEVDIYENYGEDYDNTHVDFFVLSKPEDEEFTEEYKICSKCGHIYKAENINAKKCSCGDEYLVTIFKVNNEKSNMHNNIYRCVNCQSSSNGGIIRSFKLNKDNATSMISEMIYQSIDNQEKVDSKEVKHEITNPFDITQVRISSSANSHKGRQLLAFSDSRQQASFFSIYFNYNHEKFLRRKLIWNEVKNLDKIGISSLASKLTKKIKNEDLFESGVSKAQSEAWISLLTDLLYVDGKYGAEGLGLYAFKYNSQVLDDTISEFAETIYREFGMTTDEYRNFFLAILDRFRRLSIVDYSIAELTDQDRKDAFQYTDHMQYLVLKKQKKSKEYHDRFKVGLIPANSASTERVFR